MDVMESLKLAEMNDRAAPVSFLAVPGLGRSSRRVRLVKAEKRGASTSVDCLEAAGSMVPRPAFTNNDRWFLYRAVIAGFLLILQVITIIPAPRPLRGVGHRGPAFSLLLAVGKVAPIGRANPAGIDTELRRRNERRKISFWGGARGIMGELLNLGGFVKGRAKSQRRPSYMAQNDGGHPGPRDGETFLA